MQSILCPCVILFFCGFSHYYSKGGLGGRGGVTFFFLWVWDGGGGGGGEGDGEVEYTVTYMYADT